MNSIHVPCGCTSTCGDLPEDKDHEYAVCKGLPEKERLIAVRQDASRD
jgi:hypothetical protein